MLNLDGMLELLKEQVKVSYEILEELKALRLIQENQEDNWILYEPDDNTTWSSHAGERWGDA